MKKHYKVSVIIPARDTRDYLGKCIDSLIWQTVGSIEVVVVDDGSEQDLRSLIEGYGPMDNLVYLRNEIPLGPGGARNRGMDIARGEFIGFCDSDDWLDLCMYEAAVNGMETHDADIGVFSMVREFDYKTEEKIYLCRFNQFYTLTSDMAIRVLSGQYDMGIQLQNSCLNKLFRKSFLDEAKARFEEGIYFQGILFNIYTFLRANKIICIPGPAYHHYRRANSIVQSFNEKHIHDFAESYALMKGYLSALDKFELYRNSYYRLCEGYMNMIVKEIFEYIYDENLRKKYLRRTLEAFNANINMDEYLEYISAEQLRQHIQPDVKDTTLY